MSQRWRLKILLVIATLSLVFGMVSSSFSEQFIKGNLLKIEGEITGVGENFSFEFDNDGIPGIAYYDLAEGNLKFAQVKRGAWKITAVSQALTDIRGLDCALTFDTKNRPYIAYVSPEKTLNLAYLKGDTWKTETVDKTPGSGLYCDMVLTPQGDPVISYVSSQKVMCARKLPGKWSLVKIADRGTSTRIFLLPENRFLVMYLVPGESGNENRLAAATGDGYIWKDFQIPMTHKCYDFAAKVTTEGSPVIAYSCKNGIFLTTESVAGSGIWKQDVVSNRTGKSVSLTLQDKSFPLVSFISGKGKELIFAKNDGGGWMDEKVATARQGYSFNSCEINGDSKKGTVLILHDGNTLNALVRYGEGWRLGMIDGRLMVGGFINLEILPGGTPVVCYYDYTHRELHFARHKTDKTWEVEVVDSLEDVGRYASLTVSRKGMPGISYYDNSRKDLKYAWKKDGKWHWDRVDYNQDTGLNTSLAFDDLEIPHISYFNRTTRYLKYARKESDSWHRERITKLGRYGGKSVILSKNGKRAILFVDGYKVEKVSAGESPVKNYLKIARQVNDYEWEVKQIFGPYAMDINDPSFSADYWQDDKIAVALIDRQANLRIIRQGDRGWVNEIIASDCLGNPSIKLNSDGTVGVLFLSARGDEPANLHFAGYDGKKWKFFMVKTSGKKIGYFSLGDSPAGNLRFAFEDAANYFAYFFSQK